MPAVVEFDTIASLFGNLFARYQKTGRTVLCYRDRQAKEWVDISWDELAASVNAMAGYLYSCGVRPGDRVAILSENRPEWAIADLATQFLGAVNVSLYTSLPATQVAYIVKDSGAKLFFVSTGIQLKKAEKIFDECPDLERIVTMSDLRKEHGDHVTHWEDADTRGRAYWTQHADSIRPLSEAIAPDDVSALIYTSGTTGNPKGVMLTHRNFSSNVKAALARVPFNEDDHHLSFLPLCHSFERTAGYLAVLACGAKITYAQAVDTVSRDLPQVSPTVMISVPRLFERIYNVIAKSVEEGPAIKKRIFEWSITSGKEFAAAAQNGRAGFYLRWKKQMADKLVFSKLHEKLGGNLRFAVSGGAALPAAIGEFFQAAGVVIIEGYGLTETSPVLTINPTEAPRYGTVGRVIDGVTVAIMNVKSGQIIAEIVGDNYPDSTDSEEGEVVARGPSIMKGYWSGDAATKEAIDAKGWYHTGDIGRFDGGYLRITDRIKHMIVSKGGKNIYPGPIEEYFKTQPLMDQVMVVGEGREFLTALVVLAEGVDNTEETAAALKTVFRAHSRTVSAPEKVRDFRIIDQPFSVDNGMMTPTLKLKRKAVTEAYSDVIEDMYASVV